MAEVWGSLVSVWDIRSRQVMVGFRTSLSHEPRAKGEDDFCGKMGQRENAAAGSHGQKLKG
ncbi:MAG: hypothetical protein WBH50_09975 [Fuerstiella sp.]